MDPEIEAIKENIRSIAEQGGTASDIDAYLKIEGFDTRQEWLSASDMTTPAIPEGTALGDFIATLGNGVGLGLPRLLSNTVGSGELDARLDFLEENNPGISQLVSQGGSILTGGAAGRAALSGLKNSANLGRNIAGIATPANPHALRLASGGPGLARTAGQGLLNMIQKRGGQAATAAAGGATASLLHSLLGKRR